MLAKLLNRSAEKSTATAARRHDDAAFVLPISWVFPDPNQVRKTKDDAGIHELARSIAAHGQMQPIEVRELERDAWYEIVSGERRYTAMKEILGATEIAVRLVDASDEQIVWRQLHENIHRRALHPLDLAEAILDAMDGGLKLADVAGKLGKSESWVQKALSIAKGLTDDAKAELRQSPAGASIDIAYELAADAERIAQSHETKVVKQASSIQYLGEPTQYVDVRVEDLNTSLMIEWQTSVLSLLGRVMGADSSTFQQFDNVVKGGGSLHARSTAMRAIFQSAKSDYEGGYLFSVQNLVHASVFADELDQAKHFLDNGFKVSAAVIAGTVSVVSRRLWRWASHARPERVGWRGDERGLVASCTLRTREPHELMRSVGHHRMPVLLSSEAEYRQWMNPELTGRAAVKRLFADGCGAHGEPGEVTPRCFRTANTIATPPAISMSARELASGTAAMPAAACQRGQPLNDERS